MAIRIRKVHHNPARQVDHREDNTRVRFLSACEESALRKAIQANWPDRVAELNLSLNTGLRLSEQYGLLCENAFIPLRIVTIPRRKNGNIRHVPLNQGALQALKVLKGSEFVCCGAREPRRWFEAALKQAQVTGFSWHCLRHTFASRLVMAVIDLRTVQELRP